MARYIYGASGAAQVIDANGHPVVAPASVYNSRTGGAVVSDIQNMAGLGLGGIVTPDSFGQSIFQGPDNYAETLWLDFGSGPRWGVNPISQTSQFTALRTAAQTAERAAPSGTTPRSGLPYTSGTIGQDQMTILDGMLRQKFANGSARNSAITSPQDGDRVFMQDTRVEQMYNSALSKWVALPQLISQVTFTDDAQTGVTWSNIPNTFKHLKIVYSGRCSNVGMGSSTKFGPVRMLFNGDSTATSYVFTLNARKNKYTQSTNTWLYEVLDDGTGGTSTGTTNMTYAQFTYQSASSPGASVGYVPGSASQDNNGFGGGSLNIFDYANTSKYKTWDGSYGWASGTTINYIIDGKGSGTYHGSTNAITSITMYQISGALWGSGSSLSLYGWS